MADRRGTTGNRIAQAFVGVALGLVVALAVVRVASRRKEPPPPTPAVKLAGGVLREDGGRMDEVLIHYVTVFDPLVRDAYTDFLGTLDPSTRVVAVVPKPDGRGEA